MGRLMLFSKCEDELMPYFTLGQTGERYIDYLGFFMCNKYITLEENSSFIQAQRSIKLRLSGRNSSPQTFFWARRNKSWQKRFWSCGHTRRLSGELTSPRCSQAKAHTSTPCCHQWWLQGLSGWKQENHRIWHVDVEAETPVLRARSCASLDSSKKAIEERNPEMLATGN